MIVLVDVYAPGPNGAEEGFYASRVKYTVSTSITRSAVKVALHVGTQGLAKTNYMASCYSMSSTSVYAQRVEGDMLDAVNLYFQTSLFLDVLLPDNGKITQSECHEAPNVHPSV